MLSGRAADLVLAGDEAAGIAEMRREIAAGSVTPPGIVYLVEAGPGAPDLITMRAHRVLGEADIIVFDASVSQGVLELARRDAEQMPTNGGGADELLQLARTGQRIVRLGTGLDVDDLATTLREDCVSVEVVP
jgi:uroporphyrin-III C-methyltransferase/precorrin-2 dehydrogenase/sirohydrochlorin ferrochelatase